MKFKLILSNTSTEIDGEDIPVILEAIKDKTVVVLEDIIFNPSYFQAIVQQGGKTKEIYDKDGASRGREKLPSVSDFAKNNFKGQKVLKKLE